MKQLILNALKTKFPGVEDAILDRVATHLATSVTTAEQVATAVEGVTFQQVLVSYGDSRANQASQTAVRTYESKWGLKDGQKIETGNGGTGGGQQQQPIATGQQGAQQNGGASDATNAILQQLLEQNKKLAERLDGMERDRTTTSRKQQISSLIETLPDNIKKVYGRMSVDTMSEDEFSNLVNEIKTEVTDISSSLTQRGATFNSPSVQHGGGTNQGQALTKEEEAAISARTGAAAGQGQPF